MKLARVLAKSPSKLTDTARPRESTDSNGSSASQCCHHKASCSSRKSNAPRVTGSRYSTWHALHDGHASKLIYPITSKPPPGRRSGAAGYATRRFAALSRYLAVRQFELEYLSAGPQGLDCANLQVTPSVGDAFSSCCCAKPHVHSAGCLSLEVRHVADLLSTLFTNTSEFQIQ